MIAQNASHTSPLITVYLHFFTLHAGLLKNTNRSFESRSKVSHPFSLAVTVSSVSHSNFSDAEVNLLHTEDIGVEKYRGREIGICYSHICTYIYLFICTISVSISILYRYYVCILYTGV